MNSEIIKNFRSVGKKVVAVARNYQKHARELGNVVPAKPMFFFKPTSAYVTEGSPIVIPFGCKSLHHEVELGVIIGAQASRVSAQDAMKHVAGYALALDMTARDFQEEAKKGGNPWALSKGFDTACPISNAIAADLLPDPHNVDLWCNVNGTQRQRGNTRDMIFNVPTLLEYVTRFVTMEPGDVLLTGTPEGIGPVTQGDTIECGLGNELLRMKFVIGH